MWGFYEFVFLVCYCVFLLILDFGIWEFWGFWDLGIFGFRNFDIPGFLEFGIWGFMGFGIYVVFVDFLIL